jgi:NAD(P)-dependent dehydrogenase (short-subunit alcohol dehydrogenase family)
MKTCIITGGSSGLGACIKSTLQGRDDMIVYDWSLENSVDVTDEKQIAHLAIDFMDFNDYSKPLNAKIDMLINCAGYNYLGSITHFHTDEYEKVMAVNAKALFLTAKHLAPLMVNGTICNIISNASHMPMTHSIAYNASKGAAAIMTRQMAKELFKSHGITVFGVSPAKMKNTAMSRQVDAQAAALRGMTLVEAAEYQKSKLLTGEEIDPAVCAEFICWLLEEDHRHMYLAGCILEYGS